MDCIVNTNGELVHPQVNRKLLENELVVPLDGYYEVIDKQNFLRAVYNFDSKQWCGIGESIKETELVARLMKAEH